MCHIHHILIILVDLNLKFKYFYNWNVPFNWVYFFHNIKQLGHKNSAQYCGNWVQTLTFTEKINNTFKAIFIGLNWSLNFFKKLHSNIIWNMNGIISHASQHNISNRHLFKDRKKAAWSLELCQVSHPHTEIHSKLRRVNFSVP